MTKNIPMTSSKDQMPPVFETLCDEIYWKIGRNVSLLQKIELALKHLVARSNLNLSVNIKNPDGFPLEYPLKKRHELVAYKTMGNIGKQFCDEVLTNSKPPGLIPSASEDEANFTFRFHLFDGHDDARLEFKNRLNSIVDDRNRLIHQMHTTFDFNDPEEWSTFIAFLDNQNEKSKQLLDDLIIIDEAASHSLKETLKLPRSPFPNSELKKIEIQSVIVNLILYPTCKFKSFSPPWADLSGAGKFIHKHCSEDYYKAQKIFKLRSLKKFILKTEIFDVKREEESNKYRLKPEYYLDINQEGTIFFCKKIVCDEKSEAILSEELMISLRKDSTN